MAPWQWALCRSLAARQRVYDCADDWGGLIPGGQRRFASANAAIAAEADAVVCVNDRLARQFPGGRTVVVPNALDEALLRAPRVSEPIARRMVYLGTLSERFDFPMISEVLDRLSDWTLDLWGQCQFAGHGDRPDPAMSSFLERHRSQARWGGLVERDRISSVLDAADVLVVPLRPGLAAGSSMKLYDYAARGRPIVSTSFQPDLARSAPPGVRFADDAGAFVTAVQETRRAGDDALSRQRWAAGETWRARWPEWRLALFGPMES
jgi:glycosyltransferase involved in cell wall biosynthesis